MTKVGTDGSDDYIRLDELPDEFTGTVQTVEIKDDNREVDGKIVSTRSSLYMKIGIGKQTVVQKFTPNQKKYLDEALIELGIEEYEDMELTPFKFVKTSKPFMGEPLQNGNETQPRWLPQLIPTKPKRGRKTSAK